MKVGIINDHVWKETPFYSQYNGCSAPDIPTYPRSTTESHMEFSTKPISIN